MKVRVWAAIAILTIAIALDLRRPPQLTALTAHSRHHRQPRRHGARWP